FNDQNFIIKSIFSKNVVIDKRLKEFLSPPAPEQFANFAQKIARIKNNIFLPIIIKDEVIGGLLFCSRKKKFEEEEIEILKTFTQQAGIAINNAMMYEKIQSQIRELQAAYQKLKKLDEAKSEFISIASHQLRAPLTAVKGYISMLTEGSYGKLPKTSLSPMKNVYRSNERLLNLVENLLNVSRIESGRIQMNYKQTSLENLISSVVKEMEINAQEKGIYLKFEKSSKKALPKIKIDPQKIRQVVLNLIDNAIRYTKKGGIEIKVSAKGGSASGGKIQIQISDTGEGMSKQELEKIFESFSRGVAGNRFWTEGAGLGLYIARKFVEMHKGKIWAESAGKSKGSQFYVELPME
ncbi:hypothetical protein AMJ49_04615, partial [Parcubacteria bacterium DG_74_2]